MKIVDFLFYSLYKIFNLIKRNGVRDEDLAASFFSVLLFINSLMLIIACIFTFDITFQNSTEFKLVSIVLSISIFIASSRFCKNYFIKDKNDEKIISRYNMKYPREKKLFVLLGILYATFTFISFITVVSIRR